jgi:hypothetical protein
MLCLLYYITLAKSRLEVPVLVSKFIHELSSLPLDDETYPMCMVIGLNVLREKIAPVIEGVEFYTSSDFQ